MATQSQAPILYKQPGEAVMPYRSWEQRWVSMVMAGNNAGCKAQLVQAVPRNSGFGAKMWYRVSSIWMTMLNPGVSYAWDNSTDFDHMWWTFFSNDAGIAVPMGCDLPESLELRDYDYELLKVTGRAAAHAEHEYMAELLHFGVMKFWTLKTDVKLAINTRLNQVLGKEFARGNFVGVHVRRGDKSYEVPATATQVYVDQLLNTTSGWDIHVAYVASDDPRVIAEMRTLLAHKMKVVSLPAANTAGRGQYDDTAQMWSLLTDITALQGAKAFIGTSSSTLGRLVYWLRGREEISISVDGTYDFLTNYS